IGLLSAAAAHQLERLAGGVVLSLERERDQLAAMIAELRARLGGLDREPLFPLGLHDRASGGRGGGCRDRPARGGRDSGRRNSRFVFARWPCRSGGCGNRRRSLGRKQVVPNDEKPEGKCGGEKQAASIHEATSLMR